MPLLRAAFVILLALLCLAVMFGRSVAPRPPQPAAPLPAQILQKSPETVALRIVDMDSGYRVFAFAHPAPMGVFSLIAGTAEVGADLICEVSPEGLWSCNGSTLAFVGCLAPVAKEQPPVHRVSF